MNEAYAWYVRDNRVIVTFVSAFPVTYCTISVVYANGKIIHYHGGTVYNLFDRFNKRTGMFNAFKNALRIRYDDYFIESYENGELISGWNNYHKHWAHFLTAKLDKKVIDDLNDFDTI